MKLLQVDIGLLWLRLLLSDHAHWTFQQLALPVRDLAGIDIELLRQLGQRLLALDIAASVTLALDAGECARRLRQVILRSLFTVRDFAIVRRKSTCLLSEIPEPALSHAAR